MTDKKDITVARMVNKTMLEWLGLCVVAGFLLRIVLICHPITVASGMSFWQWPALFALGIVNDLCIGAIMGLPLLFLFMSSGHRRYQKPWCWVCLGVLAALFLWLTFGAAELREFNRGLARILRWLSLFWIVSFAVRAFLPRVRVRWMQVCTALMLFVYLAVFLMNVVGEWFFWNEFGVRYNFIAVDYLVYTNEVVGNIMQSYSMGLIIPAVVIVTGTTEWLLFRDTIKESALFHLPGWRLKTGGAWLLTAAVAVPVLSLTEKAQHTTNAWYNGLQANGAYSFVVAFTGNELDYDEFYYICPPEKAREIIAEIAPVPTAIAIDPDSVQRPNIILLTMESMSADYMGRFGGDGSLTPTLDMLYGQSMAFDRMLAAGNRTVRGLEALILSRPPAPGESIIKREENSGYPSVADRLKELGYKLCFYYGGNSYFDNMEDFYTGMGFEIHDRNTMDDSDITCSTVWGVCDGDMYDRLLAEMDAMTEGDTPVFVHLLTTSNHRPYIYPDGCVSISPDSQSREGAVMYSDYALGEFLRKAVDKPWFDNTVFVVSADHCASSAGSTELPLENYHIPALIYAPGRVQPTVVNQYTSQIDLIPTLFGLLGWTPDTNLYGRNVNAPDYKPRAFVATYQDLGYFSDDTLTVLSPGRNYRQYVLVPTTANPYATEQIPTPSMHHVNTAAALYGGF